MKLHLRNILVVLLLHFSNEICGYDPLINKSCTVFCDTKCTTLKNCSLLLEVYGNRSSESNTTISSDLERKVCCPEVLPENRTTVEEFFFDPCYDAASPPPLNVYGGRETEKNEFPYLALFRYVNSNGYHSFGCAGTLISSQFILTAAHCVTGKILTEKGKLRSVRLGERYLPQGDCIRSECSADAIEIDVDQIIIHPDYQERAKQHDIALVKLSKPVHSDSKKIQSACLRSEWDVDRFPIELDHNFTVVGWGRTLNEKISSVSNTVQVPIYEHSKCITKYAKLKLNITNNQICAGGEFKKDTCDGDSGGPLISKIQGCHFLDGVVSFGKGCGLENWPGIYTNVSSYTDWLLVHMKPYSPRHCKCLNLELRKI